MKNLFVQTFNHYKGNNEDNSSEFLKEAIHMYQTLFDVAGTAMVVIAEDLTILYANQEMEHLSGIKRELIEGKEKIHRFIHRDSLNLILQYHAQRRSGEAHPPETYTFTFVNVHGEEKEIYIKVRLIPGSKVTVASLTDLSETCALENRLKESEDKFRQLFENSQEGIFQSSVDGKIILANSAFVTMLGYSSIEEVCSLDIAKDIYLDSEKRNYLVNHLNNEGILSNYEIVWKRKDGSLLTVRASGRVIKNNDGQVLCYETTVVDITKLKNAQKELETSRQYFKDIIDSLPDPTFTISTEGIVVAWNKAMELLTNVPADKMLGRGNYEYALPLYGERRPILIDYALNPKLIQGSQYSYIRREGDTLIAEAFAPLLREKNGAFLWGSASIIRDMEGNALGAINTIKDFTEFKKTQEQLKYFSMHDILTGLFNRSYFEEELKRLNSPRHYPVSIIMCDVDGLKLINDSMGHHNGDELLKATANVIRSAFRTSDAVARVGGDEFAVILPNSSLGAAEQAVKRIESAVNKHNESNPQFPLSLSIGYSTGAETLQNLVIEADNYLNRNKLHRSSSAKSNFTKTLMAMLAERDYITEGHAERLEKMAVNMADTLGLTSGEKTDLMLLAKFHDIGKVGISDKLLFKPSSLSKDEQDEMKRHSEIGYRIAQSSPELGPIAKYILHHHEWWNGAGYPLGLKGEEIPLLCRILSILDTFDAMTSDRPYRKALDCQQVKEYIKLTIKLAQN